MKNKLIANLLEQRDGEIYGAVRREIERTFDDYSRNWFLMKELSRQGLRFNVDVTESDGAVEVKADIPGVDAKNIEVQLKDNTLIIKGEKKEEKEEKKKQKEKERERQRKGCTPLRTLRGFHGKQNIDFVGRDVAHDHAPSRRQSSARQTKSIFSPIAKPRMSRAGICATILSCPNAFTVRRT